MKWHTGFAFLLLLTASCWAIDVNPARQSVPKEFTNPVGKRYSIFAGDPERVQKANEVNLKDFTAGITIQPAILLKNPPPDSVANPESNELRIIFKIKNTGKKNYILSFPDAQRYDVAITEGKDSLVYLWSGDKVFEQKTGCTFVNGGETISYTCKIPVPELLKTAKPGTYNVKMILGNYPEVSAEGTLTIKQ